MLPALRGWILQGKIMIFGCGGGGVGHECFNEILQSTQKHKVTDWLPQTFKCVWYVKERWRCSSTLRNVTSPPFIPKSRRWNPLRKSITDIHKYFETVSRNWQSQGPVALHFKLMGKVKPNLKMAHLTLFWLDPSKREGNLNPTAKCPTVLTRSDRFRT